MSTVHIIYSTLHEDRDQHTIRILMTISTMPCMTMGRCGALGSQSYYRSFGWIGGEVGPKTIYSGIVNTLFSSPLNTEFYAIAVTVNLFVH